MEVNLNVLPNFDGVVAPGGFTGKSALFFCFLKYLRERKRKRKRKRKREREKEPEPELQDYRLKK